MYYMFTSSVVASYIFTCFWLKLYPKNGFNSFSANLAKWSDTLKQFVGKSRRNIFNPFQTSALLPYLWKLWKPPREYRNGIRMWNRLRNNMRNFWWWGLENLTTKTTVFIWQVSGLAYIFKRGQICSTER